jgi:hypothetical protein
MINMTNRAQMNVGRDSFSLVPIVEFARFLLRIIFYFYLRSWTPERSALDPTSFTLHNAENNLYR